MKKLYLLFATFLFFIFLGGMLSFGRAFSILHVKLGPIPIFITEFMLLATFPLIIIERRKLSDLPRKMLIPLSIFFLFGISYLGYSLLKGNLYSLRDIVLCGYILFLPVSYIIFTNKGNLKVFMYVFIASNLICIIAGRFCIFNWYVPFRIFCAESRLFNFGLYYGFAISFYFCLLNNSSGRLKTVFLSMLLVINSYLIIVIGERALWVAFMSVIVFFFIILRSKLIKAILCLIPIALIIFFTLFYFDFVCFPKNSQAIEIRAKVESVIIVLRNAFRNNIRPSSPENVAPKITLEMRAIGKDKFSAVFDKPLDQMDKIRRSCENKRGEALDSLYWRLKIWQQTIDFGLLSPFWGRGFGKNPDYVVWTYHSQAASQKISIGPGSNITPPHNDFLTLFYKMGIIGLGLFLFVNVYVFLYTFRRLLASPVVRFKFLLLGAIGALIFWHVLAFFFNIIDSPSTSLFLWVIIGLIFALLKAIEEGKLKSE